LNLTSILPEALEKPEKRIKAQLHVTFLPAILFHVTIPKRRLFMAAPVAVRVKKRRDALRMAGLRPVQLWVPDTRRPDFAAECQRQSRLVCEADQEDAEMLDFMDEALADTQGWKG
jgi:hypothetical protein